MEQERYSVLFSSQTGNTKILAQAIAQALPAAGCDYFGDYQGRVPSSPVLFVGFWTDKGTADAATLELLKIVKNKKIFLFWYRRIWRKCCVFSKNSVARAGKFGCRQSSDWHIYVPRQNALVRAATV